MSAQLHTSFEQHEAMYEAIWRGPGGSQSTPLGNRPEVHHASDQDTQRLEAEMDEMWRFKQNQQDQLLVAIRTATAAAMAASEASQAIAWFRDEGARQSVFAQASATAGPRHQWNTTMLGALAWRRRRHRRTQHDQHLQYQPRERTDYSL